MASGAGGAPTKSQGGSGGDTNGFGFGGADGGRVAIAGRGGGANAGGSLPMHHAGDGGMSKPEGGASAGRGGSGADAGSWSAGAGGDAAGEGGSAGASACSRDDDCPTPHPATCTARCNAGVCELEPSPSLGTPYQSLALSLGGAPIAGFWDARGRAYFAYSTVEWQPNAIFVQPLEDGGTQSTSDYQLLELPPEMSGSDYLAAAVNGERIGILWHGKRPNLEEPHMGSVTTEFMVTDLVGSEAIARPALLHSESEVSRYPDAVYGLFLHPRTGSSWAAISYTGTGPQWRGYLGDPDVAPSDTLLAELFRGAPASVAGTSDTSKAKPVAQALALVGNTLFVTGYDCHWSGLGGACDPYLVIGRHDPASFEPLVRDGSGAPIFQRLSTKTHPDLSDGFARAPVIAKLGSELAAMWSERSPEKHWQLGRAVFAESGEPRVSSFVVQSDLIPQALVASPSGGALLVASRESTPDSLGTHTLVAQRLDANLMFVGSAIELAPANAEELSRVVITPHDDGRVLLTFRQGPSFHRILHADLCQPF